MDARATLATNHRADATELGWSIVVLTYARDESLKATLSHLRRRIGRRSDVEIILVDNNPDTVDRSPLLAQFAVFQVVKNLTNKGVCARNDGMAVARGEVIVLLDDDVLVESPYFLERFRSVFDANPDVGLVMGKKLDSQTLSLLPECIPHTRKSVDVSQSFLTFRFVGGLVGIRKSMFKAVGGFSPEFFFGLEEHEYSFRILKGGWKLMYIPDVISIEMNASGGRLNRSDAQNDLLRNRYMIAYLHMPFWSMILNQVLFTAHLYIHERGRINILRAVRAYSLWLRQPERGSRQPIDRRVRTYIRDCGGVTWR